MKGMIQNAVLTISIVTSITVSIASLHQAVLANNRAKEAESRANVFQSDLTVRMQHQSKELSQPLSHLRMLRLARIVENAIPQLANDDFEKAIMIRNYIHHHVRVGDSAESIDWLKIDDVFLSSTKDQSMRHNCGGLTLLYLAALESQGIPARYVGIFSADQVPYESHATVEFWHAGKWHASDPLHNIMFKHKGKYLSYSQLLAVINEENGFEIVTNGNAVEPRLRVENFATYKKSWMKYMVIHPAKVSSGNKVVRYPMQLHPSNWDGAITFADGERRDVKVFSGLYTELHEGPLR